MQIYHYDAHNQAYIGTSTARPDPLEHERFLIPANATTEAPPDAIDGQVACWTGVSWEVTADHRNTKYWLPGDDWNTPARNMADLGPLPDGAVFVAPDKPVFELIEERRAEITTALSTLDAVAIRPTRAILAAQLAGETPDAVDTARLAEIEAQAQALRDELAGLGLE